MNHKGFIGKEPPASRFPRGNGIRIDGVVRWRVVWIIVPRNHISKAESIFRIWYLCDGVGYQKSVRGGGGSAGAAQRRQIWRIACAELDDIHGLCGIDVAQSLHRGSFICG